MEATSSSISALNRACSLDITGLSNHALSAAAMKPLVETFDARPMVIVFEPRVKVIRRSGNRTSMPDDGSADRVSTTGEEGMLVCHFPIIRSVMQMKKAVM